jgi:RNA polymerase sigma-70 factor (ECF subfamily)
VSLAQRSDAELIADAAQGSVRAFEVLYDRHAALAFSLAVRIVGPDRADGVCRVALVKLWRNSHRYEPDRGTVRSWVAEIVRQSSIDELNASGAHERTRHRRPPAPRARAIRRAAGTPINGGATDHDETGNAREAFAGLPDEYRVVIELAYFEGMNQTEIARVLDLSLSTVKVRTRLGLDALRGALRSSLLASSDVGPALSNG